MTSTGRSTRRRTGRARRRRPGRSSSRGSVLRLRLRDRDGVVVFDAAHPDQGRTGVADDEAEEAAAGEVIRMLTRLNSDDVDAPTPGRPARGRGVHPAQRDRARPARDRRARDLPAVRADQSRRSPPRTARWRS